MPLNPSFEQPTYEYPVADDDRAHALREAVRNSWAAYTREEITGIRPTDEFEGDVYAIAFDGEKEPPTLGGYVEGLARHGWGYLYFDENTLYVARILPAGDDREYVFEGREHITPFDLPPIRRVPEIELDEEMPFDTPTLRDERRLTALRDDVQASWPDDTLSTVDDITCSTSDHKSYIINTESTSEYEEEDDGTYRCVHREVPDSPLGRHADALLHNGWAVATVKSFSLFVSRLKELTPHERPADTQYGYRFEGSHDDNLTYSPAACEFCEEREHNGFLVVGVRESEATEMELPVTERACARCIEEHSDEYETTDEYYDRAKEDES